MRFGTDAALVTDGERLLGIVTPPTWSAPSPPMREVGCPPPRARGDDHERCPTTDLNAMTISSVDRRSVRTSVELATRALSIHNSQSWRWRLGTRTVHLYADRQRHLAATDADGRDLVVSCGTASDGILSRLRAGEASSAVLLHATQLGLATCPLSQPLELTSTRMAVRDHVLGGSMTPQLVLRVPRCAAPTDYCPGRGSPPALPQTASTRSGWW
jgi:hypothetical protein